MFIKHRGRILSLLLVFSIGGAGAKDLYAQASATGRLYGAFYASEDTSLGKLYDSYLGVLLNSAPIASQRDLRVKADLRVARRGEPAEWDERVYSLYADWRSKNRNIDARFGRQFLYKGVMNGTVDGLWLQARPVERFQIGVFGGLAAKYGRSLDLNTWDDGGTLGGATSYNFGPRSRVEVSYINRKSSGEIGWHQVGGALSGTAIGNLLYDAQLDYNLEKSEVQAGRLRLMYLIAQWTVSAEYNNQKPRILEDSYFNIFDIDAFNQIRGGLSYRFGRYSVGAAYMHTSYEEDETADQVTLSVTGPWGVIGSVLQGGYGGDRVGLFGEVRYDVLRNVELMARASHQNYERRNVSIEQDATGFAAGVRYRPARPWLVSAELQQSINSHFDSDWRALVRAHYAFDFGPRR
jgi:hypothetical protein